MARAFAQDELLFPGDAIERILNFPDERFVIRGLEVLASEVRLDGDGAHINERTIEPINAVHEHRILVDFLLLDFNEALPHRLDITDARIPLLDRSDEPQRNRSLAIILPRGGDEDARRDSVHGEAQVSIGKHAKAWTPNCAARCPRFSVHCLTEALLTLQFLRASSEPHRERAPRRK